jgi:hypothetical protein
MTSSTVDRFQLLEAQQMDLPNKCAVCGSFTGDHDKKFITFGAWIEFFGTVYICTDCFMGAAALLDVVRKQQYLEALNQIKELQAVVTTLINENRGLRDAVDSLRSFNRPHPDTYDVSSVPEPVVETSAVGPTVEPENSSGDSGGDNQGSTTGEDGPVESPDVRGPENLRNDDSGKSDTIGLGIFNI